MGHRRDEAELAAGLGDPDIAGRAAGILVEVGQRILLGEARAQQRQRHVLVDPAFADIAHRHHFDQGQRHALAVRPLHQRGDFLLVHVLQRHRVDLHRKARGARGFDAIKHLVEIAPAGDGAEFRGVERIEGNVDAAHAAVAQFVGEARQLRAVGGQRQLIERAGSEMPRQRAHQRHHVAPDQRFAAGEADFSHALGDEGRAQPVELFQRQQIRLGQECHVLGHAVEAAQIAAIGDRHAQVPDGATKRVDHRTEQQIGRTQRRSAHRWVLCWRALFGAGAATSMLPLAQSRHVARKLQ